MSRLGIALASVAALPALASAAQWNVVPQLGLTADTDTNRRLLEPPRPSDAASLDAALAISRMTEISTFTFMPRASVSRYSGDDVLDSEDWGVIASYRRSGERTAVDAQAGLADDSTLVTEPGETGFLEGNTRRHSANASAAFTQYLGTRHQLRYQLAMSDIDYDRTLGTGLVGYRYPSADLLYVAMMSPRLEVTARVNVARLEVPLTHVESQTSGAQLGFRFRVSESFDLETRAGRSQTRGRGRAEQNQSYFASATWRNERSAFALSLSQDIEPSGYGILVHANDLRLEYSINLTERLALNTNTRLSVREDTEVDLRRHEYRYGAAVLALTYKLTEAWTAGITGSYARQEYERLDSYTDGRRVGFSLAWRPQQ